MNRETIALRAQERELEAASRVLDRLSMALLAWPRTIVVTPIVPPHTWCYLPEGWRTMRQISFTPLLGLPPWRGERTVAVSPALACKMIELLERGYRGT